MFWIVICEFHESSARRERTVHHHTLANEQAWLRAAPYTCSARRNGMMRLRQNETAATHCWTGNALWGSSIKCRSTCVDCTFSLRCYVFIYVHCARVIAQWQCQGRIHFNAVSHFSPFAVVRLVLRFYSSFFAFATRSKGIRFPIYALQHVDITCISHVHERLELQSRWSTNRKCGVMGDAEHTKTDGRAAISANWRFSMQNETSEFSEENVRRSSETSLDCSGWWVFLCNDQSSYPPYQ